MGPDLRKPSGPADEMLRANRPDTSLFLTPVKSLQNCLAMQEPSTQVECGDSERCTGSSLASETMAQRNQFWFAIANDFQSAARADCFTLHAIPPNYPDYASSADPLKHRVSTVRALEV